MGLFGALFAGVSGLDSQSNKIGIISNNISNVNTVGFKQGQAAFDTLVVPSGTTTFSPGGVIGSAQSLISQQGLIQATSSPTDVAITGNGFFAVNSKSDGSGSLLLSRAGSFTQDSSGNFVNANGFFLQGIPVTTPATSVNTNNLKTVNVNQSATGSASATSAITIGANFNAAQSVLLGSGATGTMQSTNGTSPINVGLSGSQIIAGADLSGPGTLVRGTSAINIISGTNPLTMDTFTYGGYTIGRDVTSTINGVATAGDGDGSSSTLIPLDTELAVAGANITNTNGTGNIVVTVAHAADYVVGQHISITGASAIGPISAANINGEHAVTAVNVGAGTVTFAQATIGTGGTSATAFNVANRTYPFTGNILNATSATSDFLNSGANPLTSSNFSPTSIKFSITVGGSSSPVTLTYSATPDPTSGTFNNLSTLAAAISNQSGLTARVVNNRLYVSATDATQSVTFVNGDALGTSGLPGIDWVQELDLKNQSASTKTFNSLSGLAAQINLADPTNLIAKVNNPNTTATISINEANPKQTVQINDVVASSVLKELGFTNLTLVGGFNSTGLLPVQYDSTTANHDMSSGAVTPQFSHDITIFDAQGNSHTIAMNVVKIATNTWAIELTAVPATDVASSIVGNNFPNGDGQIAAGTVTFSGTGALTNVSGNLSGSIPINWKNGASPSSITVNLGVGQPTGLTQSAAPYNVSTASQNGSPIGQLTGVSIDANGFVIETFSNGQTKQVFQVPLASVSNPDGLQGVSGDAFQQTLASGQVNLNPAGSGGTGTITPSSLEQSNVDLSTQLTNLIVAQQAYGANAKLLTVSSQLLQQLDQIIQ